MSPAPTRPSDAINQPRTAIWDGVVSGNARDMRMRGTVRGVLTGDFTATRQNGVCETTAAISLRDLVRLSTECFALGIGHCVLHCDCGSLYGRDGGWQLRGATELGPRPCSARTQFRRTSSMKNVSDVVAAAAVLAAQQDVDLSNSRTSSHISSSTTSAIRRHAADVGLDEEADELAIMREEASAEERENRGRLQLNGAWANVQGKCYSAVELTARQKVEFNFAASRETGAAPCLDASCCMYGRTVCGLCVCSIITPAADG